MKLGTYGYYQQIFMKELRITNKKKRRKEIEKEKKRKKWETRKKKYEEQSG